jgi:hypothetical protein
MLIGITGYKFSGKSTVAKMLSEMLGYETHSFADKLKYITCILSGCTREDLENYDFKENELVPDYLRPYCLNAEKPTYRAFLQHFGSEVMRGINDGIWIDCTLSNCGENAIISDCRFPNEAKAIKERGGVVIKVVRDSVVSDDTHQSETKIDEIEPDYVFVNNKSLKELRGAVSAIVELWKVMGIV